MGSLFFRGTQIYTLWHPSFNCTCLAKCQHVCKETPTTPFLVSPHLDSQEEQVKLNFSYFKSKCFLGYYRCTYSSVVLLSKSSFFWMFSHTPYHVGFLKEWMVFVRTQLFWIHSKLWNHIHMKNLQMTYLIIVFKIWHIWECTSSRESIFGHYTFDGSLSYFVFIIKWTLLLISSH